MELRHIVERCQQGDREAFSLLYSHSHDRLQAFCESMVHNKTIADDLLHDAFVLIFTHISEVKDADKADVWMKAVVRNVARLYLRDQQQHRQVALTNQSEPVDPTAELFYDDLLRLIDHLPEGYRNVFRLSVFEGLSHHQIASLLHINPHSSASQLYHARQLLRQWLKQLSLILLLVAVSLAVYLTKKHNHQPSVNESQAPILTTTSPMQTPRHSLPADSITPVVAQRLLPHHPSNPEKPVLLTDTASHDNTAIEPVTPVTTAAADRNDTPSQPDTLLPVGKPVKSDAAVVPYLADDHRQPSDRPVSSSSWTVALAYSSLSGGNSLSLPYATAETNAGTIDTLTHHYPPLTISLMVSRQLGRHWLVGTGLRYQRLTSDMQSGNSYASLQYHNRLQYLGIPLTLAYQQPWGRHFTTYVSASAALDLPLRSTQESVYLINGNPFEPATYRLHPSALWSVGMGVGLQYNFTPHAGFFLEPSLHHYFPASDGIETRNTAHPFTLSLPFGLRITF